MRKRIFALAVPVVLVVLGAIYLFSSGHSEIQTYTDQDHLRRSDEGSIYDRDNI